MMKDTHVAVKNGKETTRSLCTVPRHVAVNNAFKTILSPAAIKRTLVVTLSVPHFCLILPESGFYQHVFTRLQYKISRESIH